MDETVLDRITLSEAITPLATLFSLYVFILISANLRQNRKANKFLAFLILQFIFILGISSLVILEFYGLILPVLFLLYPMFLFIAPTCFCYIKALTTENYSFSRKEKYHMLFPVAFLLLSLVLNTILIICKYSGWAESEQDMQETFMTVQGFAFDYILILQFFIYSTWMVLTYLRHRRSIKDYFSNEEGVKLRWLWFYIFGFIVLHLLITVSSSQIFFLYDYISYETYDILYIGAVFLFVGYVGFNGVKQKEIYNAAKKDYRPEPELSDVRVKIATELVTENSIQKLEENLSGESLLIADVKKLRLKESILELFEKKKIFLNESLTIEDVAHEIKSNRTYISYTINDCFGMNFYNFVNEFRIKAAKDLLVNPQYYNYSMEGIGRLVGFKSKSSFNSAFKKQTGKTPTEYKSKKQDS